MNTQFRKGAIEMCVLALIGRRDMYGYELVGTIAAHIDISEGTVYPILRRLTMDGHLTTYLRESPSGPARKYYTITPQGRKYLQMLIQEWGNLSQMVATILRGDEQ